MVLYSQLRLGLVLGFTQDAPQFFMKIINNMLIGKEWTSVMILSPLYSCYSVTSKLVSPFTAKKKGLIDKTPYSKVFVVIYIAMWSIGPLIYIFTKFSLFTKQTKDDWTNDVTIFDWWATLKWEIIGLGIILSIAALAVLAFLIYRYCFKCK